MSVRILSTKSYVAGWLDSSIHDFLKVLSPGTRTKYALITSLDSNPRPASLLDTSPELKSVSNLFETLGSGLLLPTEKLLEIDSTNRILFGFDEVSLFPNKSIKVKPGWASLVGPARLSQSRLNKLDKWMSDNDCSMALGDGEGLNFVVRARGLVKFLLGFTIEQREPYFVPSEEKDPA